MPPRLRTLASTKRKLRNRVLARPSRLGSLAKQRNYSDSESFLIAGDAISTLFSVCNNRNIFPDGIVQSGMLRQSNCVILLSEQQYPSSRTVNFDFTPQVSTFWESQSESSPFPLPGARKKLQIVHKQRDPASTPQNAERVANSNADQPAKTADRQTRRQSGAKNGCERSNMDCETAEVSFLITEIGAERHTIQGHAKILVSALQRSIT